MSTLINGNELSSDEYGDFYSRYIDKSAGKDLIDLLDAGSNQLAEMLQTISNDEARFSYAEGKWTIKEVVGHMVDTERIMALRSLAFARGDTHPLPGFDQDAYVEAANFNERPLDDLMHEYRAVRSSTIQLFSSFTDEMLTAQGTASGSIFSVRALGYVIAGHEIHHLEILREKYLTGSK